MKFSKSGRTIYFNNKAFKKYNGVSGNYYDAETNEEYWISGVKKNGTDRHWAGSGKILIDSKIVNEYLRITEQENLDLKRFEVSIYLIDKGSILSSHQMVDIWQIKDATKLVRG